MFYGILEEVFVFLFFAGTTSLKYFLDSARVNEYTNYYWFSGVNKNIE